MTTFVQTKSLVLNTKSRTAVKVNGRKKSKVLFTFPYRVVTLDFDIISIAVTPIKATFPNTALCVTPGVNDMIEIHWRIHEVTDQIYIRAGNYDYETFLTEVHWYIQNVTPATSRLRQMTFRYEQRINRIIISTTDESSFVFETTENTTASWTGFIGRQYTDNGELVASSIFNVIKVTEYYIESTAIVGENFSTATDRSYLFSVPNDVEPYELKFWSNLSQAVVYANSFSFGNIDILITDQNGNELDFDDADWTIELQFTIVRKPPNGWSQLQTIPKVPKDDP